MSERRKRLIEVAFPLEEVSTHSRTDNYGPQGHISQLHGWWARRPLAACRAFIYASLVDDPKTDAEREELLKEVADLASWDAVRHPDRVIRAVESGGSGQTGAELLKRARRRILDCNGGEQPRLLDPFAGGGAIPFEGLRLGCRVEASDLNPVAVLILKGTLEYPQRYGQPNSREVPRYISDLDANDTHRGLGVGQWVADYIENPLATDVRYWATWVLERAREELVEFYPPDADGSLPVAYLWSRTIPCPSCDAEMPLIRQYWLARKQKKRVALEPVVDSNTNAVDFRVVEGPDIAGDPARATTARGDTRCLLCGQIVKAAQVRQAGVEGQMSARMTAVVLATPGHKGGKRYRTADVSDALVFKRSAARLATLDAEHRDGLALVPDEPIDKGTLGLRVDAFGLDQWGELFNDRQLLSLTTFARLVGAAHSEMHSYGLSADYAAAVATYLGLVLDKVANQNTNLARWENRSENLKGVFARQALPMVWDYAEASPTGDYVGSWKSLSAGVVNSLVSSVVNTEPAKAYQHDATNPPRGKLDLVVSDPPYYDAIDYAGLSDFFYVWMKRSVGGLYPDLLQLPLTPKADQAIMASESGDPHERARYVRLMRESFKSMHGSVDDNGMVGVVFAHTNPDAWSTLIEGLLSAGLVPKASWPIDTESPSKVMNLGSARLRTSVWMACGKRDETAPSAFLGDVLEEMRPVIRERLLYFWSQGIRGADFFISAIGPGLSVFGRYARVLNPDGSTVNVRDFLDRVRRESTTVALEQVLQDADLGMVDPLTQQYVSWVWSYSRAALESGEALALCLATGTRLDDVTRDHSIAVTAKQRSKKVVKLRTIAERARDDDDLGGESSGRTVALIDQLQCAGWLWGQNQSDRLGKYRAALGESRWSALLTLGQAVASCLPEGDEDRRMVLGLLGATVRPTEAPAPSPQLSLGMDEGDGTE